MNKIIFYPFLLLIIITGCSAREDINMEERVNKLHEKIISIDTHLDTPLRLVRDKKFDIGEENNVGKLDFPRMKEGDLDAAFFAVYMGQGELNDEGRSKAKERALKIISVVDSSVEANNHIAAIALKAEDAGKLKQQNKLAIFLGMENGYPVGNDISNVELFYEQGIRYITLCHSENNDICDSSTDPDGPEYNGLSKFGESVVNKMNDLGMMVDVSHVSDSTFYDVLKLSEAPVIASHSCVRALRDHPRNLSDEMIRALADKGGVVQICFLTDYLKKTEENPELKEALDSLKKKYPDYPNMTEVRRKKMYAEWEEVNEKYNKDLATVSDLVDHIDHVVKVAGIDYVGIGSDFDGGGELEDCNDVSQMKNITRELIKRGYSDEDIAKIWGGNFLRVFKEVEGLRNKI